MLLHFVAQAQKPYMVKEIGPGASGNQMGNPVTFGSQIIFTANDSVHGKELWISNGTSSGTNLITDINPGLEFGAGLWLMKAGNKVFFEGNDNIHGSELWVTDGTATGTRMVKDIIPGSISGYRTDLRVYTDLGGTLLFSPTMGDELWKSDGTAAGTVMVKDLYSGTPPNRFYYLSVLFAAHGKAYFTGTPDTVSGRELWVTDGTTSGTVMLKDINPGTGHSSPMYFRNLLGKVFFMAYNDTNGGIWCTDGTEAGTYKIKDIQLDAHSVDSELFIELNGWVYFGASNDNRPGLWKTNGTSQGTMLVKEFSTIFGLNKFKDKLYFAGGDNEHGIELWSSDGTESGTQLVKDIALGKLSSFFDVQVRFMPYKDELFFVANDNVLGYELWKTNGSANGTSMVADIYPGIYPLSNPVANPYSSYPYGIIVADNILYFDAKTPDYGYELWAYSVGTGLQDDFNEPTFTLFPNPAKQTLNLGSSKSISSVTISDISGRTVYQSLYNPINDVTVDVQGLSTGMYIVRTNGDNWSITKKLLIDQD